MASCHLYFNICIRRPECEATLFFVGRIGGVAGRFVVAEWAVCRAEASVTRDYSRPVVPRRFASARCPMV